ncbi:MAG: beta-lactamase family protein, partial [bacterium]
MKKTSIIIGTLFLFLLISQMIAQPLPIAKPEDAGMSSTHLNLVKAIIKSAIERKDFPGSAILVARKGKIVLRDAFGKCQWVPEERPMKVKMIFDLASITKPVATATSIMILAEQGRIRLWDKVKEFVPEFAPYVDEEGNPAEDARIWHLLTHTSGLPPYANAKEVEEKYGNPCTMDSLVKHIAKLKKSNPP